MDAKKMAFMKRVMPQGKPVFGTGRMAKKMTQKQDDAYDKKNGIKEGSKADMKQDKKNGVMDTKKKKMKG